MTKPVFGHKDQAAVKRIINEKSLVIIKPDAVVRQITGDIISRFERKGLKIVALKLVHPTKAQVEDHYALDEDWLESTGNRTLEGYKEKGYDITGLTAREVGLNTRRKLMNYLGAGPVIALVLQGAHVIEIARRMRGSTSPLQSEAGTVGFDYSLESYELADAGDWAIRNILHGSDSPEAAEREIPIWFSEDEFVKYETAAERYIYSDDWHMKPKGK